MYIALDYWCIWLHYLHNIAVLFIERFSNVILACGRVSTFTKAFNIRFRKSDGLFIVVYFSSS